MPTNIFSPETENIHLHGVALLEIVAQGATDVPTDVSALPQTPYAAHWSILLLRCLDRSPDGQATDNALEVLSAGLAVVAPQAAEAAGPAAAGAGAGPAASATRRGGEQQYSRAWRGLLSLRITAERLIHQVFGQPWLTTAGIRVLRKLPFITYIVL